MINFDKSKHIYSIKGKYLTSVTTIVKYLFKPFDIDYWAEYKAAERMTTPEIIKKEWQEIAKFGTNVHNFIDYTLKGLTPKLPSSEKEIKYRKQAIMFLCNNRIEPIKSERIVGDIIYKAAGTIDLFCKINDIYGIIDWKTNKDIEKTHYENKCLKFNYLPDNNFTHYSFQQNIYRFLLEKELGIEIKKIYLCHLSEDSYNLIECLDLRLEVEELMNKRKNFLRGK